ncbi:MAG: gliding motility-associated C-terminal domain-containing protein [Sphingobacteriales bacterium]|nr:gliding motility-associated C-terminal domain-containing protein [Sphingobacteriales bacterium]
MRRSGLDGAISYEWITATGLSCTDCAAPTAQPAQTTLYTVQASDNFGCVAEASALVNIIRNNVIVVPNAFSPNGDGNNDVFRLQGTNVKTITLHVYNRWGNNIYTATGDLNSVSWDGSYNNAAVEIGVYVFQADITYQDGKTEMLKGNITVLR